MIKAGELKYKDQIYEIAIYEHFSRSALDIVRLVYSEEENKYTSCADLLWGRHYVKDNICYYEITYDRIFDNPISEMQLTYSPLE